MRIHCYLLPNCEGSPTWETRSWTDCRFVGVVFGLGFVDDVACCLLRGMLVPALRGRKTEGGLGLRACLDAKVTRLALHVHRRPVSGVVRIRAHRGERCRQVCMCVRRSIWQTLHAILCDEPEGEKGAVTVKLVYRRQRRIKPHHIVLRCTAALWVPDLLVGYSSSLRAPGTTGMRRVRRALVDLGAAAGTRHQRR